MGIKLSKAVAGQVQPSQTVLVPPQIERDLKDRDRFTKSSYDFIAAKRSLDRLLGDYLQPGPRLAILISPPADQRLSAHAYAGRELSTMELRWQPQGPAYPNTFVDVHVNPRRAGDTTCRASMFDPASGLGVFATAPLAKRISRTFAQVGVRYSSPDWTAGVIAQPRTGLLDTLWLVGRYSGVTAGLQIKPDTKFGEIMSKLGGGSSAAGTARAVATAAADAEDEAWQWLREHSSVCLTYEPSFNTGSGHGRFCASVEIDRGRSLIVSFFQHMAITRRVVNPMEGPGVVGITNYLDFGMQITSPITPDEDEPGSTSGGPAAAGAAAGTAAAAKKDDAPTGNVDIAASWQVNKNVLTKLRVGSSSAAAALVLRAWSRPSALLATSVTYDYASGKFKVGAALQIENHGALRYERGVTELQGKALVQRHEANAIDLANAQGMGRAVAKDVAEQEYNTPSADRTADYL